MNRTVAHALEWLEPMRRGIARARTLGLAAEMAFWVFLSLVPLAAVAGLVAARLATQRGGPAASLLSSVPAAARSMVQSEVAHVAAWRGTTVAPLAIGMFLWLAASGVHAVFDALEVQTGASRAWWKKRLLAMATCVGLSVGVAILGFLTVGLGWLESLGGKLVRDANGSVAGLVVRAAVAFAVAVSMVAALYRVGIPRKARASVPIWPGAAFAVSLVALLGFGYSLYVSTAGTGDAYEGSLAVIGITLMTLWLFSVAILLGAELNKVIADRRTRLGSNRFTMANPEANPEANPGKGASSKWPTSEESSYRRISPKHPSAPSIGPSRSPNG